MNEDIRLQRIDIVYEDEFRILLEQLNNVIATGENIEGNVCYPNDAPIEYVLKAPPLNDILTVKKRVNLRHIAKNSSNFLEIGLNAGHSALILLMSNLDLTLYCVDIAHHAYTHRAAEFLKAKFGTRFHFWFGDSRELLPEIYIKNPNLKFDAVHIDGGHSGGIAFADMSNSLRMAKSGAFFIVDDFPHPPIADAFSDVLKAGFIERRNTVIPLEKTELHEIAFVV